MVDSLETRAKKLGALMQDARLASGKSEEDCADAMGVSTTIYQTHEQGESAPSLPELEVFAYFLDVPLPHFLGRESVSFEEQERSALEKLERLIPLRHRIIGVMLRKARLEADISFEELSRVTEIDQQSLETYESGTVAVPLPELEVISIALSLSMREFQDKSGPVGKWAIQKKAVEDFLELPLEMQQFVSKPINLPYLELAQRLSEMSVDRLRGVAEGLLEITL